MTKQSRLSRRRTRQPRAAALVAVLAVALAVPLAGCGGSGGGDQLAIKQTLQQFLAAIGRGDGSTACSHVTPAGQQALATQIAAITKSDRVVSCQLIITELGRLLPAPVRIGLAHARIDRVTVNGKTASVKDSDIHATQGDLSAFLQGSPATRLQKIAGVWLITT